MFTLGTIIVEYVIDNQVHRDVWDSSVNVKYIMRVLESRNATNIKFRFPQ